MIRVCILSPLEQKKPQQFKTGSNGNYQENWIHRGDLILKKLKSGQVKVTRLLDGPIIHAGLDERMLKV